MEKLFKENIIILIVRKMDFNVFDYIFIFKVFIKFWDNLVFFKLRIEEKIFVDLKFDSVRMIYISFQIDILKQSVLK